MTITNLVSKSARRMNKQLLKTSGSDVLSCRKKLGKTLRGGGRKNFMEGGIHPPPPLVRPRVNIRKINIYIIVTVVVVIIYLLFLFDTVVLG